MFLLGMVVVQICLQGKRTQAGKGILSHCLTVKVHWLPRHKQTLQHIAQWG